MKTYLSLSGFDTTQILSLIVKYGIEKGDTIVLIRPEVENDERAQRTIEAVQDLSKQIDSDITVKIHRVNHLDFESMVLDLTDLIRSTEGKVIANISGGPREIFLPFSIACLMCSNEISITTNFSDVDRTLREVQLPAIRCEIDEKLKMVLKDIIENGPTLVSEVAGRLNVSESTASRQINKLVEIGAVEAKVDGKKKEVKGTLTGKLLVGD